MEGNGRGWEIGEPEKGEDEDEEERKGLVVDGLQ